MNKIKKYGILFYTLLSFVVACNTQKNGKENFDPQNNEQGFPVILFDKTLHNFGRISKGEVVTFTFFFENTGDANLIINDVKASCGCTTPEWTKEPVKPGGKGKIEVSFDSSGRSGNQQKLITVYSNSSTNNAERLTITAEII